MFISVCQYFSSREAFAKPHKINKLSDLLEMNADGSKPTHCIPLLAVAH